MRRILPLVEVHALAVTNPYVCVIDAVGITTCHETTSSVPTEGFAIPDAPAFTAIGGGGQYFCGIATSDGTPWCWRHGDMNARQVSPTVPLRSVSAGYAGMCGLDAAGAAWCWNQFLNPTLVPGGHQFRQISVGSGSICAVESSTLWCWNFQGVPERVTSLSAAEAQIGSFNLIAVNTSSVVSIIDPSNGFSSPRLLPGTFPVPTRQLADLCAVTFAGAVYCADEVYGEGEWTWAWTAIPVPQP